MKKKNINSNNRKTAKQYTIHGGIATPGTVSLNHLNTARWHSALSNSLFQAARASRDTRISLNRQLRTHLRCTTDTGRRTFIFLLCSSDIIGRNRFASGRSGMESHLSGTGRLLRRIRAVLSTPRVTRSSNPNNFFFLSRRQFHEMYRDTFGSRFSRILRSRWFSR